MLSYYKYLSTGLVFESRYKMAWENNPMYVELSAAEGKQLFKQQCIQDLKKYFYKGATVYCIIRSVARSGMSRTMDFFAMGETTRTIDNVVTALPCLHRITYEVSKATSHSVDNSGALRVKGCGMDMRFHVVDCVMHALYYETDKTLNANCINIESL